MKVTHNMSYKPLTCILVLIKDVVHPTEGIVLSQRGVTSQSSESRHKHTLKPLHSS